MKANYILSPTIVGGRSGYVLEYGATYYLYPIFKNGYEFDKWSNTQTASVSSVIDPNPSFVVTTFSRILIIGLEAKTASPTPTPNTMQGFSNTAAAGMAIGESKNLIDARDGNAYTVTKLDDDVWMIQNLRFTGSYIDSRTTNIDTNKIIYYNDLVLGNSYDEARIHYDGDVNHGAWYNYAAASAMTITGRDNSKALIYSLCPAGWRLPTKEELESARYQINIFNPIAPGDFTDGNHYGEDVTNTWWSAEIGTSFMSRWYLYYDARTSETAMSNY